MSSKPYFSYCTSCVNVLYVHANIFLCWMDPFPVSQGLKCDTHVSAVYFVVLYMVKFNEELGTECIF